MEVSREGLRKNTRGEKRGRILFKQYTSSGTHTGVSMHTYTHVYTSDSFYWYCLRALMPNDTPANDTAIISLHHPSHLNIPLTFEASSC